MKNQIDFKKVKKAVYVIAIMWIAVATQLLVNRVFLTDHKIIEAFASTQTSLVESELQIVGDYGNRYLSEEDKEQLIAYIASKIGLSSDYELKTLETKKAKELSAIKEGKNATTAIKIISVQEKQENGVVKTSQYIIVRLSIYEKIDSVITYKTILEKAMKELGVKDPDSVIKLKGIYAGKLSMFDKNKEANQLLSTLQAKVVKENRSDELFTIYAYTNYIKDYITFDNKRINVNVAVSYDETKDQTILYLATPILNDDF